MEGREYRVWCKNNNEWEKNGVVIDLWGSLLEVTHGGRLKMLRPDTHILYQSTGIEDKNGKKIFVGDLVEHEMEVNGIWELYEASEVVFDDDNGIYCFKDDSPNLLTEYNNLEVVGNIHDKAKTKGCE